MAPTFSRIIVPVALLVAVCLSCTHLQRQGGSSSSRLPAAQIKDPTYEEVEEVLLQGEFDTLSSFLVEMKKRWPDFFNWHTLMYQSLSLQGSSFKDPRAIVFGRTADFVMTYNGSASQKGFAFLEVRSFSERKGFQYREVAFKKEPIHEHDDPITEEEIEKQSRFVSISKPNIQKCTQCHSEKPRPIWQPYFIWPGAYGSDDDILSATYLGPSVGRAFDIRPGARDAERVGYNQFLDNLQNPRYQVLPTLAERGLIASQRIDSNDGVERLTFEGKLRPNLHLNSAISDQLSRQIISELVERNVEVEKNLAVLSLIDCRSLSPLLLSNESTNKIERAFTQILQGSASWEQKLMDDHRKLLTEDIARTQENFGGALAYRTYRISNATLAQIIEDLVDVNVQNGIQWKAHALEKMGIDIRDYAVNLRRLHVYQDGINGFPSLSRRALRKLQSIKNPEAVSCENIMQFL